MFYARNSKPDGMLASTTIIVRTRFKPLETRGKRGECLCCALSFLPTVDER